MSATKPQAFTWPPDPELELLHDERPFGTATPTEVAAQLAPWWPVEESKANLWVNDRVARWLVHFGIRHSLRPYPCESRVATAWEAGRYTYPHPDYPTIGVFVQPEYVTCPPDEYSLPPNIDGCDWVRPWWTTRNERLLSAFWPRRNRIPFADAEHMHVAPTCAKWLGAASDDEVEYYILNLHSFHFPLTERTFLIAGRRGYDVGRLYKQIRDTEHKKPWAEWAVAAVSARGAGT